MRPLLPYSLVILLAIALPNRSIGQGIEWDLTIGGSDLDYMDAVHVKEKEYILAGTTKSPDGHIGNNNGNSDGMMVWVDSSGSFIRGKNFGGNAIDGFYDVISAQDNGYILVGRTESPGIPSYHDQTDAWVVKTDSMGNLEWQKAFGGSGDDVASAIVRADSGEYLVLGSSGSSDGDIDSNYGNMDFWAFKINSAGTLLWENNYGGSGYDLMPMYSNGGGIKTSDDGAIMTGSTTSNDMDVSSNNGGTDYWAVKIDSTGSLEWERSYGGAEDEEAQDIAQTEDGGYALTGWTSDFTQQGDVGPSNSHRDFWTIKVDSLGNLEWEAALGGNDEDRGESIDQTADGGFLLTGTTYSSDLPTDPCPQNPDNGASTILTIKLNSSGDSVEWSRCSGGTDSEFGKFSKAIGGGKILLSGNTWSENIDISDTMGLPDTWIAKLDTSLPIVSSSEEWGAISNKEDRINIAPNPTSGKVYIRIQGRSPEGPAPEENGKVRVWDQMGRQVLEEAFSSGRNTIDLSGHPQGIYLVRVRKGDAVRTAKVVKE